MGNNIGRLVASLVVVGALGMPAVSSAQNYNRRGDRSVVVDCAPGQRAVLGQRRQSGRTQVAARCDGARNVSRRGAQYEGYEPERTKTETALMIGGAAATGAGVGGAISGTKGALIGAAIGGGAASIYESTKRR